MLIYIMWLYLTLNSQRRFLGRAVQLDSPAIAYVNKLTAYLTISISETYDIELSPKRFLIEKRSL